MDLVAHQFSTHFTHAKIIGIYSVVMRSSVSSLTGSSCERERGLGVAFLLPILVASAMGCGRIPGLLDPARQAPTDSSDHGDRRGDGGLDAPKTTDTAAGSGGAARDTRADGAGGVVGAGGAAGATTSCSGVVATTATRQPADVLLVLDRSGSMNYRIDEECSCDPTSNPKVICADTVNCQTRWASLVAALDSGLSSTPFLRWGLKLFSSPNGGSCDVTSSIEVPFGDGATSAIQTLIATITPAGDTPTAAAIATATGYLKTQTDPNNKVILLATDGKPNCGGPEPSVYDEDVAGTIDAITAAINAGFLVYVVGIGTGTSADNLDSFAQAGGTQNHYSAQSPSDLTLALDAISKAATCTYALVPVPPAPSKVGVYLDKDMVPQDASNGWTFGASSQTVILHGTFCDQALDESPGAVQALFACDAPLPVSLP